MHTHSSLKATALGITSLVFHSRTSFALCKLRPFVKNCLVLPSLATLTIMLLRRVFQQFCFRILALIMFAFPVTAQAEINVFACEPEWASLAQELGGDRLNVFSATTAMQDPHHIQARPSLIAKARRADLLVCSGAELEIGWLPLLQRKAGNNSIMSDDGQFYATDYVDMLEVPKTLDRSQGDVHADGNPHIHTSPQNILLIAEALSERLTDIDATNAEQYRQAYSTFSDSWKRAMQRWRDEAADLKGTRVISHHRYWSYLNAWLGLDLVATLEAVPGVSPSSSHLAKVNKIAKDEHVSMIIYAAYLNDRPALWLSERTGIPPVALPATVDYQSGQTLEKWFDQLISKLVQTAMKAGNGDGSG